MKVVGDCVGSQNRLDRCNFRSSFMMSQTCLQLMMGVGYVQLCRLKAGIVLLQLITDSDSTLLVQELAASK